MKRRTAIVSALALVIPVTIGGGYIEWQHWERRKGEEKAADKRVEKWEAAVLREAERKYCVTTSEMAYSLMMNRQRGTQPARLYAVVDRPGVDPDSDAAKATRILIEEAFKRPRMELESNRKAEAEEFAAQAFSNCMEGKYK